MDPPELTTEANVLKLNSEMDCRSSIGLLGFSILSANKNLGNRNLVKNTFLLLFLVLENVWAVGCGSMPSENRMGLAPLPVVPAFVSTSVAPTKNPQVASYSVITQRQDANVTVDFGVNTNYGLQTWTQPVLHTLQGNQLNMLVAGMRTFTTYHM